MCVDVLPLIGLKLVPETNSDVLRSYPAQRTGQVILVYGTRLTSFSFSPWGESLLVQHLYHAIVLQGGRGVEWEWSLRYGEREWDCIYLSSNEL